MKKLIFCLLSLFTALIQTQAQTFLYFEPSDLTNTVDGRSGSFTLTKSGRFILSGVGSGTKVAPLSNPPGNIGVDMTLRRSDNTTVTMADQGSSAGGTTQGNNAGNSSATYTVNASFHALAVNLPAGTYSFGIEFEGNTSVKYALVTLPDEPASGLQQVTEQILADYTAADTVLRNEYLTLIDQMQAGLETSLTDINSQIASLENRVTELENSTPSQDPEIAELQEAVAELEQEQTALRNELIALVNQVEAALQAQIDEMDTQIASLQAQIIQLQTTDSGHNAALANLQTQINSLVTSRNALEARVAQLEGSPVGTSVTDRSEGLKDKDYLIMGGMAAGATALGVGIYSIVDESSKENLNNEENEAVIPKSGNPLE